MEPSKLPDPVKNKHNRRSGFVLITVLGITSFIIMLAIAANEFAVYIFEMLAVRTEILHNENTARQAFAITESWLVSAAYSGDIFSSADMTAGAPQAADPIISQPSNLLVQLIEANPSMSFDVVITDQHYPESYRTTAAKHKIPQCAPFAYTAEEADGSAAEYKARLVNIRVHVCRLADANSFASLIGTYEIRYSDTNGYGVIRRSLKNER